MKNWFKKQVAALSLALSSVEKNAITQTKDTLGEGVKSVMDINEGRLSNDLMKGKITKEVQQMRWRMYKVLFHSKKKQISSEDDEIAVTNVDLKKSLDKISRPDSEGDILMCIGNAEQTLSMEELEGIKDSMSYVEFDTIMKTKRRLIINREYRPKFEVENFAEKLIVYQLDNKKVHLDFYINRYSDIYNKKTAFLIKEIEKAKKSPRLCDMLSIDNLGFITNEDIGIEDFLEFLYKIDGFKEVIDFEGYYILRFTGEPLINGDNVIEDFIDHELEDKYKNKVKKT